MDKWVIIDHLFAFTSYLGLLDQVPGVSLQVTCLISLLIGVIHVNWCHYHLVMNFHAECSTKGFKQINPESV